MDVRRLLQFRTVVEVGGVNAAAPLLHLSPGAVSKAVRKLEEELGDQLFDRTGRSLQLTDFGKRVYDRSERLVSEYRTFLRDADAAETREVPTLRIASFEPFTTHVLGALVGHDPELATWTWRVIEVPVGEIERAIADREADVGVTYAPAARPGVTFRRLVDTRFGLYGNPGATAELPHAAPVTRIGANAAHLLAVDAWPELVPRDVTYRLTSLEAALALARHGLCLVHLPAFIPPLHNRVVRAEHRLVEVAPPRGYRAPRASVQLVVRPEDRQTPRVRRFGSTLAAVLQARA